MLTETSLPQYDKEERLLALYHNIRHDRHFEHLRLTGINFVPGGGPYDSEVMLIGEAPGQDENSQRLPFVGKSGQLLRDLIRKADLDDTKFFITNVVKYNPPHNRKPNVYEMQNAKGYTAQEINIINPRIIVLLGATALNLFYPTARISRAQNLRFERKGRSIFPCFHPSAALRDLKKEVLIQNVFEKVKVEIST